MEQRDQVLEALKKIDDVLGVMKFEEEQISEEALQLMKRREALRQEGRWAQSDEIRQRRLAWTLLWPIHQEGRGCLMIIFCGGRKIAHQGRVGC